MKSADIYAQGYAVPSYDIDLGIRHWRFRDEEYTLPFGAVAMHDLTDCYFQVAKIDDIREAACR